MPELVNPTVEVHASFLETLEEYREDREFSRNRSHFLRRARDRFDLASPEGFEAYVAATISERFEDAARQNGWVPQTVLWYADGTTFLGRLSIRHRLNDWLSIYGGHIGYEVRPSARGHGHATDMLCRALPHAEALGIDPALITCDHDNEPSRRVIEANGGIFDDRRGIKLRYWVPTT